MGWRMETKNRDRGGLDREGGLEMRTKDGRWRCIILVLIGGLI